jgi:hypothetical protein
MRSQTDRPHTHGGFHRRVPTAAWRAHPRSGNDQRLELTHRYSIPFGRAPQGDLHPAPALLPSSRRGGRTPAVQFVSAGVAQRIETDHRERQQHICTRHRAGRAGRPVRRRPRRLRLRRLADHGGGGGRPLHPHPQPRGPRSGDPLPGGAASGRVPARRTSRRLPWTAVHAGGPEHRPCGSHRGARGRPLHRHDPGRPRAPGPQPGGRWGGPARRPGRDPPPGPGRRRGSSQRRGRRW